MKTNPNDLITEQVPNGYGLDSAQKLTKREYFAAMAMQGIQARNFRNEHQITDGAYTIAELAVRQADALIHELNKESNK